MPNPNQSPKEYALTLDEVSACFFHVLNCYIHQLEAEIERYRVLGQVNDYNAKWAAGMIKHQKATIGKLHGTFMTILANNSRPDWIAEGIALATIERKKQDATADRVRDIPPKEGMGHTQDRGRDSESLG